MIWGLIPVKDYLHAKSRLAAVLPLEQRKELARNLFLHVAAQAAQVVDELAVLTDSAEVATDARALGARVLLDRRPGLAHIVDDGLDSLRGERALVLMADLPRASREELQLLVAQSGPTVVPDRHGLGTNALLTFLPAAATCFGSPRSFTLHEQAGYAALHLPELAWDLDTPDDLYDSRAQLPRNLKPSRQDSQRG